MANTVPSGTELLLDYMTHGDPGSAEIWLENVSLTTLSRIRTDLTAALKLVDDQLTEI